MSVQKGNKQHDSFFMIERLARRIMDDLGRDHRWKEYDMTYIAAYRRAQDMKEDVLFRYTWWLMRKEIDMKQVASFRGIVCRDCFCGYDCDIDHSAGITLRDIMIYLVCHEVVEEINRERWDYFQDAVA